MGSLGDVLGGAGIPDRRTGCITDDFGLFVEEPHGAVSPDDPVLGRHAVAGLEIHQTRRGRAPIIRMDEREADISVALRPSSSGPAA